MEAPDRCSHHAEETLWSCPEPQEQGSDHLRYAPEWCIDVLYAGNLLIQNTLPAGCIPGDAAWMPGWTVDSIFLATGLYPGRDSCRNWMWQKQIITTALFLPA